MQLKYKKKYLLGIILASNVILTSFPAYSAEDNNSNQKQVSQQIESPFLSLYQAIEISVQNNYQLKIASEKINVSKYTVTENAAQGLPQLNVTASYGRQDPVSAQASAAGSGLGNNPQFAAFLGTARVNTFRNQVALSQVLFAGFRVIDGIRMANISVELSEEGYRQSRQEVVQSVSGAYYNSLKAAQLVQINKLALRQAELHLDQAKKLEKAGVGIKLDVLRANNQLVNVQMQISQSLNSFEKAKKALNLAMGRSIDQPIELNTQAKVPEIEIKNVDDVINQALNNRSELKQLKIKKEMDEILTTIQSRANWPTIAANVSYNLSDTAVVNGNSTNSQNLNYGVNMNWPVFDGLLTNAKVQKAQNTIIQDQITIDQFQQTVILEIKQTLLDIQEAKERLILAKEGIKLAEEALRLARIRYENGVGISLDVIDSQTSLMQANASFVNTEFDLNVSRIKLYKALGIDI